MKHLIDVFMRELSRSTKDHSLVLTLLIAPIVYAFLYGSIYSHKVERGVKLAVVDTDGSTLSRLLTKELRSTPNLKTVAVANLGEAEELFEDGSVQGYFYIEPSFAQNVQSFKQANVTLAVNASRFLPASDITAAVTNVCLTVGAGIRKTYFNKQGMNDDQAMLNTNPVRLDYRPLFNESSSYGAFILPGLLAMILQQTFLIGLSYNMSKELEGNTVNDLFHTSGQHIFSALMGKMLFYLCTFFVFSQFILIVSFNMFEMPNLASHWQVSLWIMIFLLAVAAMAMLIGSFFKQSLLVVQILGFSSYPIFMITGYSMPFYALPAPIQWISNLLPTTPFLKLYTQMVQGGARFNDQPNTVIHLLLLLLLFFALVLLKFRSLQYRHRPVQ